jgi:hypothetical protein
MSLSFSQTPATVNLAQSPIAFSVYENSDAITSSSFQYVLELSFWTGSISDSGSSNKFTFTKFPNKSDRGIFDVSRVLYSALPDLAQANTSNAKFFKGETYFQYLSGSTMVTGSHLTSSVYVALDGYSIFQEPIGQAIQNKTLYWPLMTDGPSVQTVLSENIGTIGLWRGQGITTYPYSYLIISSSTGNQAIDLASILPVGISSNTTSSVYQYPLFPSSVGAPALITGSSWYTVQLGREEESVVVPTSDPIRFNVECNQKYPNVRIKWKNRFGQFDYMNFNLASRESFSTTKRTYQPQLGSWEGTSLSYNNYDSSIQNYVADSKQTLTVNSNWLTEDYNEILKQLLVSDEIYWVFNEPATSLRPLTIETSDITFKTGVVDKLIQYELTFNLGQNYKLLI